MSTTCFRGRLRGGTVVLLDEAVSLPDGTYVTVTPLDPQPGNGAAIVAALAEAPKLPEEDVKEFDRFLTEVKQAERRAMAEAVRSTHEGS